MARAPVLFLTPGSTAEMGKGIPQELVMQMPKVSVFVIPDILR